MQDILECVLVNHTTFYKYYSGKSDLAAKTITEFKQESQKFLAMHFNKNRLFDNLFKLQRRIYKCTMTLLLSAIKYFFEQDQNVPAELMLDEIKNDFADCFLKMQTFTAQLLKTCKNTLKRPHFMA